VLNIPYSSPSSHYTRNKNITKEKQKHYKRKTKTLQKKNKNITKEKQKHYKKKQKHYKRKTKTLQKNLIVDFRARLLLINIYSFI
jgi:hypothetical protein